MTTTPTFPAVVFSVTDAGIAELEAKHRGLVVAHGDKKGYLALTQAIAEVRAARTDVEKRRKELKQDALDYGRLVDSTAKAITARLEAIELPLKDQKDEIDAEVARIKREKEETERARIAGIQSLIAAIANAPAALATSTADRLRRAITKAKEMEITEDEYAEFVGQANEAKTAAINALDMMLDARIAADEEEAARKAEADRIAAEAAKLAAERAEFDRQQAEARRQQEEADRARREAEQAEAARLAAERKAQQDEIDRQAAALRQQQAEFDRKQAEAKEAEARAEAAKQAAAEAEKAAKAKAEAVAKLAAEIEAAKPERERLIGYARGALEAIPETTTTIGNHMRADLVEALEGLLAGWKAA